MDFLKKLGIKNENYGACYGPDGWLSTNNQGKIDSINPSDNKKIASVYNCSIDDYTKVVNQSLEAKRMEESASSRKRIFGEDDGECVTRLQRPPWKFGLF